MITQAYDEDQEISECIAGSSMACLVIELLDMEPLADRKRLMEMAFSIICEVF